MPIHRLEERPTHRAVLVDITCDSDGKIDKFVGSPTGTPLLDLHEVREGERYFLGAFLIGAYQETLGDLHNLFGDTHVVHIRQEERGGWWIEEVVRGDSARDVLGYVQYDVKGLYPSMSRDCERAVRDGRMTLDQSQALLRFYESALDGYTYLT
jgi:arginine decarboxylase